MYQPSTMLCLLVLAASLLQLGAGNQIIGGHEAGPQQAPWQVMRHTCHVSAVTCHVPLVMCHVPGVAAELPGRDLPLLRRQHPGARVGGDGGPLPGRPLRAAVRRGGGGPQPPSVGAAILKSILMIVMDVIIYRLYFNIVHIHRSK